MRSTLIDQLEHYLPCNRQEETDRRIMLELLKSQPDLFERRSLLAHMTASAWVVNAARDKVLMVYHNIYNSWSWTGGHADGQEDLAAVALREVQEESGIQHLHLLQKEPFSLEILTVDGHLKRGAQVNSHLHLNVTYLIEADEKDALIIKEDENRGVRWFGLDEALQASNEVWMREQIYRKLNEKLQKFKFTEQEKEKGL